jgi:hypothetical protein
MPPKVATRSSLEQVMTIDRLLRLKTPVGIERMAVCLECCARTVRRHVAWMETKLGVRVVRSSKGLRYADGQHGVFTDSVLRRAAR